MDDDKFDLGNNVQKQALDAFYGDYLFEGVQLMHGHLESCVRTLIFACGPKRKMSEFIHVQGVSQDINLSQGIKCLYVLGFITKEQYDKAVCLNKIRNKMIHELHTYKALKDDPSINRRDMEEAFKSANALSNELLLKAAKT